MRAAVAARRRRLSRSRCPRPPPRSSKARRSCPARSPCCSSPTTGTGRPTSSTRRRSRSSGASTSSPTSQERLAEKALDPRKLGYFVAVRALIGEGNDQYADDMFSSHDGRFVYISRPSLADVVGDRARDAARSSGASRWRATAPTTWRSRPTARGCSSPTRRRARCTSLDTADGREGRRVRVGRLAAREQLLRATASRIFHASIGLVYTPADQPVADSTKGDRWFQIVDAQDATRSLKRLDIGQILAANGHQDYSSAVRPMAIAPGERIAYLQLSFLHGFVEFDLATDKPLRIANLPVSEEAAEHAARELPARLRAPRPGDQPRGHEALRRRDDVRLRGDRAPRRRSRHKIVAVGRKPYWSTNSADGRYCFVSFSGDDEVVGASTTRASRRSRGSRSATTRSGCGWGSSASDALGGLPPSPRRRRHARRAQAGEAADRPRARARAAGSTCGSA